LKNTFPGFLAFTDCTEQSTQSKSSKEREEKKTILFRQEKETHHGQESVYIKSEGDVNLQNKT
jgi:hypothetical protein